MQIKDDIKIRAVKAKKSNETIINNQRVIQEQEKLFIVVDSDANENEWITRLNNAGFAIQSQICVTSKDLFRNMIIEEETKPETTKGINLSKTTMLLQLLRDQYTTTKAERTALDSIIKRIDKR